MKANQDQGGIKGIRLLFHLRNQLDIFWLGPESLAGGHSEFPYTKITAP